MVGGPEHRKKRETEWKTLCLEKVRWVLVLYGFCSFKVYLLLKKL